MQLSQILFDTAWNTGVCPADYTEDVRTIQVLAQKHGIKLSAYQAVEVWADWSAKADASWLVTIDESTVKHALTYFISNRLGLNI